MREVTRAPGRPEDILEDSLYVLRGLAEAVGTLGFLPDDSPRTPGLVCYSLERAMTDCLDRAEAAYSEIHEELHKEKEGPPRNPSPARGRSLKPVS